jgi:hypothetical protein
MSLQYVDSLAPGLEVGFRELYFGSDAALRLCASPLAILGGWQCKASLRCRVLWLAL